MAQVHLAPADERRGRRPDRRRAVVAARWLAARGAVWLELFSLQRRRSSGSLFSKFLRVAPWAHWIPSSDGVVLMLISANVAVFMLWRLADPRFMRKHFMISLDNFKSGRLHTLLTSAFSHAEADHLFTNMIGLYFLGTSLRCPLVCSVLIM